MDEDEDDNLLHLLGDGEERTVEARRWLAEQVGAEASRLPLLPEAYLRSLPLGVQEKVRAGSAPRPKASLSATAPTPSTPGSWSTGKG